MDQQRFEFPVPDDRPRRRRRRRKTSAPPRRQVPADVPLADSPVLQECGRCGYRQTVLAQTALCARCGVIMVRRDQAEDNGWVQPLEELPAEEETDA